MALTDIVEKPGHFEMHECQVDRRNGQMYWLERFTLDLPEGFEPKLTTADEWLGAEALAALFHPSVVRAVQKRLGIVNKVTVGWVVKTGELYMEPLGLSARQRNAVRFRSKREALESANMQIDGMYVRVVRLWRRG